MRYRSNPIEIQAELFANDNRIELALWLHTLDPENIHHRWSDYKLFIKPTSCEWTEVKLGFYVIKERDGYKGFYPCNPDIFNERYTKISF